MFSAVSEPLCAVPLSADHLAQLHRAVELALPQWLQPVPEAPLDIVVGLERVLLFLKQSGTPSAQARQLASLAFAFGAQVVRGGAWHWASVSEDGHVNPALVSADGARACLPVDVVTALVMRVERGSLGALYRGLLAGDGGPMGWAVVPLAEAPATPE